ncbi:cell wall hydrolase [filamentous cyanobacterium CCP5]|nr:cell wall hydrolase [filamentous cyanobacterium CCP5]
MSLLRFLPAATAALLGLGLAPAAAIEFDQQSIPSERVVAVASPVRNGELYSLLILEQLSNSRPCWQESGSGPVRIEPLLLNFDFTGICDRKTDSNGYSLRVDGEDLALSYRLEITRRSNDLVLQAVPFEAGAPRIDIGHTSGITNDFAKIELYPGWEIARRTYNGQALGHLYLNHEQPLGMAIAQGVPDLTPSSPSQPTAPLPNVPLPSAPAAPSVAAAGSHYRVVVSGSSDDLLAQVRAVEPSAFRTRVDGQSVIQAGLFQESNRAEQLRVALAQRGLPVKVLAASAPAVASTPSIPSVPQGELVVVIDPGHGGRDPGAIGIGGLREKDINTAVSRRVQQTLQQRGVTAIMTRDNDTYVTLEGRTVFADRVGADVFVSIHANAISLSRPEVNGLETYYYSSGQRLAEVIHNSILRRVNIANRGVRQARFYVLRRTSMPAVLVETGFVTGSTDAARFRNPAVMNQMADAIAEGILAYLGR